MGTRLVQVILHTYINEFLFFLIVFFKDPIDFDTWEKDQLLVGS